MLILAMITIVLVLPLFDVLNDISFSSSHFFIFFTILGIIFTLVTTSSTSAVGNAGLRLDSLSHSPGLAGGLCAGPKALVECGV